MDQERGGLEENLPVKPSPRWWGLRPWKRHSTALMVVGILYIFIGYQYMVAPSNAGREKALMTVLQFAPLPFWGSLFVFAGALAIISTKWPPMAETWGYVVVTSLSVGWAATYLTGIWFFQSPKQNYSQVFLWGTLGFMWMVFAGFPNPEKGARRGRR
jgi:hypothetical protein